MLWCRLAAQFKLSIAQVKERIPASEMPTWDVYFARYAETPERADLRTALLSSQIVNTIRGILGNNRTIEPQELILKLGLDPAQSDEEISKALDALVAWGKGK